MPKLLADGREFQISADAWDAWKAAARPFELPDDVLRRVLSVTSTSGGDSKPPPATGAREAPTTARGAKSSRTGRRQKSGSKRSRVASDLLLPESESSGLVGGRRTASHPRGG
jgi:hypothetical protein